jgi:hypothetical protein
MKRILLLVILASMLAAAMALSGVAQAAQGGNKATAQCRAEAVRTLQPGFKPSDYNFVAGTEEANDFDGQATAGPDVFCGFGGNDSISTLDAGDIFIGGAGNDSDLVASATGTAVSEISDGPTDKSTAHPAEKSALSSIDTSTPPSRKT